MSGFEFTIACSTCGLLAHDYPWYRRLFSGEVELPVVDADGPYGPANSLVVASDKQVTWPAFADAAARLQALRA